MTFNELDILPTIIGAFSGMVALMTFSYAFSIK
jgi:hypothetical protein